MNDAELKGEAAPLTEIERRTMVAGVAQGHIYIFHYGLAVENRRGLKRPGLYPNRVLEGCVAAYSRHLFAGALDVVVSPDVKAAGL
jgi:hypothetical protein